jgi:capsular polysaccharide biosynthesis protein
VTLRDYVLIVARSWIVVVVTVIVGLVTAGILALTATTTYTASAQVLFTGHATTSGQDLAYVGNYVQSRMQTYKNLGTSTSLLTSVAQTIGSDDTPRELAERTDIEVSQLNTVATVSATDTTAKGAAKAANTLGAALLSAVQKIEADNAADPGATGKAEPAKATVQGVITGTAEAPSSSSDPDIPLYLLAGLFAGLAASIGVISLREVLRGDASTSPPSGEDP